MSLYILLINSKANAWEQYIDAICYAIGNTPFVGTYEQAVDLQKTMQANHGNFYDYVIYKIEKV